jgi:hypothetical protein
LKLFFAMIIATALAHVAGRPDLDPWMNGRTSRGGYPCCSHIDGSTVPDAEWDTAVIDGKNRYRVRIDGKWIAVSEEQVVDGPNKFGQALAWIYRNADGTPAVRCFLPGAGG